MLSFGGGAAISPVSCAACGRRYAEDGGTRRPRPFPTCRAGRVSRRTAKSFIGSRTAFAFTGR